MYNKLCCLDEIIMALIFVMSKKGCKKKKVSEKRTRKLKAAWRERKAPRYKDAERYCQRQQWTFYSQYSSLHFNIVTCVSF